MAGEREYEIIQTVDGVDDDWQSCDIVCAACGTVVADGSEPFKSSDLAAAECDCDDHSRPGEPDFL